MSKRGTIKLLMGGCAVFLVLTLTVHRWGQAQENSSRDVDRDSPEGRLLAHKPLSLNSRHLATGYVDAIALYRIVTGYFYAVGENRLAEAMSFYHEDSPQADAQRRELESDRSAYLQRTDTLAFDLVHNDGKSAVVVANHRHLRIAGIKFMEEFTETHYVLRRQGDVWKLWSSIDRPQPHSLRNPLASR